MLRPRTAPKRIPEWGWELHLWWKHGRKGPRPKAAPVPVPLWFWPWHVWRLAREHVIKPVPVPPAPVPKPTTPISMFDDVNISLIPKSAPAVAGYVGGHWPTFKSLAKAFPHAELVSIAVTAAEDAMCLDVERGDATPDQAPAWVRRQHARGVKLPIVYTSASLLQGLVNLLAAHGLKHGRDYLIWSAHYTFHPHFCSPACGFGIRVTADATQWTDHAFGRSLDQSLCQRTIFS
jgi:hypothetical protein